MKVSFLHFNVMLLPCIVAKSAAAGSTSSYCFVAASASYMWCTHGSGLWRARFLLLPGPAVMPQMPLHYALQTPAAAAAAAVQAASKQAHSHWFVLHSAGEGLD
jgi:hypothetical protein